MYASKKEFVDEVNRDFATIKGQNSWAKKYFELEMPSNSAPVHAEVSAERCWRMYVCSRDNALQTLLLGEVSMRSKLALVQNFGLTSAFGHEDDEPWLSPWLGTALKDPVGAQAKLTNVNPLTLDEKKNAHLKGLQGSGSILSERLWTPLMNDAWLLGGVHTQQNFHLVTEGLGEDKLVAAMDALKDKEKFERTRAKFGNLHRPNTAQVPLAIREAWRQWFIDNPRCLYEAWGPRVLVRELIGLMAFGYEPAFRRQELGFQCVNPTSAMNATVGAYSDALNTLLFHQGADLGAKRTVVSALSKWMFGRDDALT